MLHLQPTQTACNRHERKLVIRHGGAEQVAYLRILRRRFLFEERPSALSIRSEVPALS
jgi:hypothetical protein